MYHKNLFSMLFRTGIFSIFSCEALFYDANFRLFLVIIIQIIFRSAQ